MKKKIVLVLLLVSMKFYSQKVFEKGYFIDESDQKIECLIEDIDPDYSPSEFIYKLSENTEEKKATIDSVKEFGIYSVSKYIRATVGIDKPKANLSHDKYPIFVKEVLFLRVIVDGKSDLFSYNNNDFVTFFYRKENSNIEQLFFKTYLTVNNTIKKNFKYKEQLWDHLKCLDITERKILGVAYKEKDLVDFFVDYNECWDEEFVGFGAYQKKDLFNLTFRPRLNTSSLSTSTDGAHSFREINITNETTIGLGIEAEIFIPSPKNRWALIFEPTYLSFKSEQELYGNNTAKVDYKAIETPLGVRCYFFLSNHSKIFINGSCVMSLSLNSNITFDKGADLIITNNTNFGFGMGYKYKDNLSLELRYHTDRNVLDKYAGWTSSYKVPLSIIVGYSIF